MKFSGQRILVVGAGISGVGAARALAKAGAQVTLSDMKVLPAEQTSALTAAGIECVFGTQPVSLLNERQAVVVSPGIPLQAPIIQGAIKAGIPVISEVEVAYCLTKAPIYAITGTNGKTTTTTLLGDMLAAAGQDHVVAGNIGMALSEEVAKVGPKGVVVAEISSFQLETIETFRPHVAVILNITPDHFERHGSMDAYVAAKARIFENQSTGDILILNMADPYCAALAKKAPAMVYELVAEEGAQITQGAYIEDGKLTLKIAGEVIPLVRTEELQIQGRHNWENALASSLMACLAGVPQPVICGVLRVFKGLEHRVEFVAEKNGIKFYNDSKATNTDATIKAIEGFAQGPVLIAGGHDKQTDLQDLVQAMKKCSAVILTGAARKRFARAAAEAGVIDVQESEDLAEAVRLAYQLATEKQCGNVLYSPACSSFDCFKNYRERGRAFKQFVKNLEEV